MDALPNDRHAFLRARVIPWLLWLLLSQWLPEIRHAIMRLGYHATTCGNPLCQHHRAKQEPIAVSMRRLLIACNSGQSSNSVDVSQLLP